MVVRWGRRGVRLIVRVFRLAGSQSKLAVRSSALANSQGLALIPPPPLSLSPLSPSPPLSHSHVYVYITPSSHLSRHAPSDKCCLPLRRVQL